MVPAKNSIYRTLSSAPYHSCFGTIPQHLFLYTSRPEPPAKAVYHGEQGPIFEVYFVQDYPIAPNIAIHVSCTQTHS